MIDCAVFEDDLEKTQTLPVLTPELLLEATLGQQEAEWRKRHAGLPTTLAGFAESDFNTEGALFEVCGSLRDALAMVLNECRSRGLELSAGNAARHALDAACDRLDRALSAPGFAAPDVGRDYRLDSPVLSGQRKAPQELFA